MGLSKTFISSSCKIAFLGLLLCMAPVGPDKIYFGHAHLLPKYPSIRNVGNSHEASIELVDNPTWGLFLSLFKTTWVPHISVGCVWGQP